MYFIILVLHRFRASNPQRLTSTQILVKHPPLPSPPPPGREKSLPLTLTTSNIHHHSRWKFPLGQAGEQRMKPNILMILFGRVILLCENKSTLCNRRKIMINWYLTLHINYTELTVLVPFVSLKTD